MFSGIIQQSGEILTIRPYGLDVFVKVRERPRQGGSVAVNGVCLTVLHHRKKNRGFVLSFDLSKETIKKTTLGKLRPGRVVNIEFALKVKDALGGHLVQGHVDGTGTLHRVFSLAGGKEYWFKAPSSVRRFLVPKGSVTIDGVSLTVVAVKGDLFSVSLIPYTLYHTTLGRLHVGEAVNVEADIVAKYVEKYLRRS